MRKCIVLNKKFYKGTGTYYRGKLVHRGECKDMFKIFWWRYKYD